MSRIIGIVAVDRRGAIGKAGGLPWHYPADMRFFRERTTGHACVMGRRTWETLKGPLKGRLNVVLTTGGGGVEPGPSVVVVRDVASVLALREYLKCDLYVIGGARVYEALRGEIEGWYVTEIPLTVEGADTHMPADFLEGFEPRESHELEGGLRVTHYARR